MRIYPISLSYQAVVSGRLSHPAANPLRLTLRMRDGESLAAPCVLRAELHTSRFVSANTTPLAVVTVAASPFQGEWNLDFTSAQMNQPTPPEGVRKLWLVVYATEGSTILYTFAGIDVDLGWHAISQATPPPPSVPLLADVGGRGWQTGWQYEAETLVVNGTTPYVSLSAHTSSSATEPGVGADWATVWQAAGGVANVDWGDIGGSLSSQVDLMEALDAKQDTSALGTMASQAASAVAITGGSIGGTTSINTTGSLTAAGAVSFTSATAGAVSTSADITVNGLRLGRGNSGAITSTAFGDRALSSATGTDNTAFGAEALRFATSSTLNVAFGGNSLRNLTSSSNNNAAIGLSALRELTSGSSNNVAIGINAGRYQTTSDVNLTTCNNSVFIGAASRASANNLTNQVVIGGIAAISDGSNTTVIGTSATITTRFAGSATSTVIISGNELRIANSATPTETEATVAGGIKWGADYLYVATATNTWKRIPLRSYSALIPISEGGTGASTAAGARANLGLETVVDDATTARTLASADAAKYIRFTSASAITITIPTNATDPIPIGSEYFIRRASTGAISLSNAGVTVNNSDIANLATGRVCCLKKVATDTWDYI